jgi:dTDP-4-dehydrorhamnose reductase
VGDSYRDQFDYAGHYQRPDDLDKIAGLGIKKLRYPILWEKHVKTKGDVIDWSWAEQQLCKIIELGMDPVVGLVHHGSGPSFTDLMDIKFADELALFAAEVAKKFPFITYYTPVNEPLTTARFSGQYGWWYPHLKNQRSFVNMLLNQCEAIIKSMVEIRKINPHAKLIQTEDLGKTYSKPRLSYQADFENERRWFSLDLLCGKLTPDREIWGYFQRLGITEERLMYFIDNKMEPDIMGFNYYITSERFLDDDIGKYPAALVGGNGQDRYVDVEAARVVMDEHSGPAELLKEAWVRYGIPLVLTEVHIGCTREEQLRWLHEIWTTCCSLNEQGVKLKAVTPWSLLGAFDWNTLLTKEALHYETGVFDISSGELRPTALASMIHGLATCGKFDHPLLAQEGWWKRDLRLLGCKKGVQEEVELAPVETSGKPTLLVIGRHGTLAKAFARICALRSIPAVCLSRHEIDILQESSIGSILELVKPWAVINCSGFVDVDRAENEPNRCMEINAVAPAKLAGACRAHGIPFMTFSSDLVFNGEKKNPYTEKDFVKPLSIYGESKAAGEVNVLKTYPDSLVIRSSAFFGPWDKYNFVYSVLQSVGKRQAIEVPDDVIVSPTYVPDLVNAAIDLLIDKAHGIWHISNTGQVSWADFAEEVVKQSTMDEFTLVRKKLGEMPWAATRPVYSVLESERGPKLPSLENALERYFMEAAAV